ncbi:hypothetical protein V8G54_028690 [Vigna mungo]|uniref:Uncharacterized protein n=1 Tax=Vigna mungo TaxID=3915 RepID=A0AAQ3MTT1_VIGMU
MGITFIIFHITLLLYTLLKVGNRPLQFVESRYKNNYQKITFNLQRKKVWQNEKIYYTTKKCKFLRHIHVQICKNQIELCLTKHIAIWKGSVGRDFDDLHEVIRLNWVIRLTSHSFIGIDTNK